MQEIWKDVVDYEGLYKVSNLGNVRSCERKVYFKRGNPLTPYMTVHEKNINQHISNTGYYRVGLRKDGKRKFFFVHRLVSLAFVENPENKPHVNHMDGNRLNNHSDNLEWVTCQENIIHARDTGLSHGLKGDLSPHKVAVLQYEKDGTFIKRWSCMAEAARHIGGTKNGIYSACNLKNCKTYKGYIWKYEGE